MAITSIKGFLRRIAEIYKDDIREEMNDWIQVFVVNRFQFSTLIKYHRDELVRIANASEDQDIKDALLSSPVVKNPKGVSEKLLKRFLQILDAQLAKTPQLRVRRMDRGRQYIYVLTKVSDINKTAFDIFQQYVMAPIRADLVENSKAGSTKRILGLLIAGLDIDVDDIADPGAARKKVLGQAPLSDPKKSTPSKGWKAGQRVPLAGAGAALGHFRGRQVEESRRNLNALEEAQRNIVELRGRGIRAETEGHMNMIHKFDAVLNFNKVIYNMVKGVTGEVDIAIFGLESDALNNYTGAKGGRSLTKQRNNLIKHAHILITGAGSLSILDTLKKDLIKLWVKGIKPRKNSSIRKRLYKLKGTVQKNISSRRLDFNTIVNRKNIPDTEAGSSGSMHDVINVINNKLTNKIRQNMGKGGSKKQLNWRTGRFGESAKVTYLMESFEKGALEADVRYHGWPYTRFEKGGDLWKSLRDPKGIFGRSIRQILQEEKIVKLRKVKVHLERLN